MKINSVFAEAAVRKLASIKKQRFNRALQAIDYSNFRKRLLELLSALHSQQSFQSKMSQKMRSVCEKQAGELISHLFKEVSFQQIQFRLDLTRFRFEMRPDHLQIYNSIKSNKKFGRIIALLNQAKDKHFDLSIGPAQIERILQTGLYEFNNPQLLFDLLVLFFLNSAQFQPFSIPAKLFELGPNRISFKLSIKNTRNMKWLNYPMHFIQEYSRFKPQLSQFRWFIQDINQISFIQNFQRLFPLFDLIDAFEDFKKNSNLLKLLKERVVPIHKGPHSVNPSTQLNQFLYKFSSFRLPGIRLLGVQYVIEEQQKQCTILRRKDGKMDSEAVIKVLQKLKGFTIDFKQIE